MMQRNPHRYQVKEMTATETMIRIFATIVITIVIGLLFFGKKVTALEITANNFDYVAYADTYPDVKDAFGYNRQALYNHYVQHGRAEGRTGTVSRAALMNAANFDGARYAADYPDVGAAFGGNNQAMYQHYLEHGVKEGRVAWSTDVGVNSKLKAFDVVTSVTNGNMSSREKVRAVHDWIIKNTAYNLTAYQTGRYSPSDFNPVGPMLLGTAVCQGYAEAFDLCMDMIGIPCRVAYGVANGGGHAWNEVMIDGVWLSVDVTFDDPIPDRGNSVYWDKYLLISQEQMALNHTVQGYY